MLSNTLTDDCPVVRKGLRIIDLSSWCIFFVLFFQLITDELSKIHCAATATTLNVTWKVINRKLFQIKKTTNRITVWRNKTHAQVLNKVLDYSTDQYFVENLGKYIHTFYFRSFFIMAPHM